MVAGGGGEGAGVEEEGGGCGDDVGGVAGVDGADCEDDGFLGVCGAGHDGLEFEDRAGCHYYGVDRHVWPASMGAAAVQHRYCVLKW